MNISSKIKCFRSLAAFFRGKKNIPECLYIELTNICTSNCIFCAHQHDLRKRIIIDNGLFQKAVDEYAILGGRKIGFTPPGGEPLVDQFILEKLEYVRDRGFTKVHFFTNMSLFNKFDPIRFLKSGIVSLHISTAPLDDKIYKLIYRSDNYYDVLNNISGLLQIYNKEKEKTLKHISIEFRSGNSLKECISSQDFIRHIKPHLNSSITLNALTCFDSWNGSIHESDLLTGMTIKDCGQFKLVPCKRLFNVQVMINGDIRLCGCRYDPYFIHDELVIGNIRTNTIEETYNSDYVKKIMGSFFKNKLPTVCKKCSWYEIGL